MQIQSFDENQNKENGARTVNKVSSKGSGSGGSPLKSPNTGGWVGGETKSRKGTAASTDVEVFSNLGDEDGDETADTVASTVSASKSNKKVKGPKKTPEVRR